MRNIIVVSEVPVLIEPEYKATHSSSLLDTDVILGDKNGHLATIKLRTNKSLDMIGASVHERIGRSVCFYAAFIVGLQSFKVYKNASLFSAESIVEQLKSLNLANISPAFRFRSKSRSETGTKFHVGYRCEASGLCVPYVNANNFHLYFEYAD